eukprot:352835-Chlamydomonas_euryale.AAC.3
MRLPLVRGLDDATTKLPRSCGFDAAMHPSPLRGCIALRASVPRIGGQPFLSYVLGWAHPRVRMCSASWPTVNHTVPTRCSTTASTHT